MLLLFLGIKLGGDSSDLGGYSSVVRASDACLKDRGFESLQERREMFLLQGVDFRYPFHPRVTAVARKHAYTLHMWLCMK